MTRHNDINQQFQFARQANQLEKFWTCCAVFLQENPGVLNPGNQDNLCSTIVSLVAQTSGEIGQTVLEVLTGKNLITEKYWMEALLYRDPQSANPPLIVSAPPEQGKYLLARNPEWLKNDQMIAGFIRATDRGPVAESRLDDRHRKPDYTAVDFFFRHERAQYTWVETVLQNGIYPYNLSQGRQDRLLKFVQANLNWRGDQRLIGLLARTPWESEKQATTRKAIQALACTQQSQSFWLRGIMDETVRGFNGDAHVQAIVEEIKRIYLQNQLFKKDIHLTVVAEKFCNKLGLDELREVICPQNSWANLKNRLGNPDKKLAHLKLPYSTYSPL